MSLVLIVATLCWQIKKSENGKLILTARRKGRDRNEIKKQTVEYICPIFRFAKQTFYGG